MSKVCFKCKENKPDEDFGKYKESLMTYRDEQEYFVTSTDLRTGNRHAFYWGCFCGVVCTLVTEFIGLVIYIPV